MPAPSNANALTLGRPLIETALIDAAHDLESLKYALRTQLENLALSLTGMGWPSGAQGSDAVYQSVYYADAKFWGGVPTDPLNPDELFDPAADAASLAFKTISVSGQDDVVADAADDTLTLVAGSNVTITTSAAGDSITIAASGDTGYGTIQEEGTPVTQRDTINFIGGSVTVADDAGNSRTNVTITDTNTDTTYSAGTYLDLDGTTFNVDLTEVADYDGGEFLVLTSDNGTIEWNSPSVFGDGTGYDTIEEEGSALTQRDTINFKGVLITATDNAGTSETDVTVQLVVQDEGNNLTERAKLNFLGETTFAEDNSGTSATDVRAGEQYALLIADIPAATINYDATQSTIDYGFAENAVIPMEKIVDAVNGDTIEAEMDGESQLIMDAVNPHWITITKAGTTTNENKPVIVRGYKDTWNIDTGDAVEELEVFVLTEQYYPVTIMSGQAQGAVSSTSFTADNLTLLWGRHPDVTELTVANPESWEADDNAYCLIMQLTDGTWQVIDLDCPA